MHLGHKHWELPVDFSNIQLSVWISLLPVSVFLWKNLQVLKLETHEEYHYFMRENGLSHLLYLRLSSYLLCLIYSAVIAMNFNVLFKQNSTW